MLFVVCVLVFVSVQRFVGYMGVIRCIALKYTRVKSLVTT